MATSGDLLLRLCQGSNPFSVLVMESASLVQVLRGKAYMTHSGRRSRCLIIRRRQPTAFRAFLPLPSALPYTGGVAQAARVKLAQMCG